MYNAAPFRDQPWPLPCLLNAIYLWGIALSASPIMSEQEPIFLSKAFGQLAVPSRNQDDALQKVQTHILLSNYFMRSGHTNEGKVHSDAAMWLAMRTGFHKPTIVPPSVSTSPKSVDPADKAAAFWAAYYLDKCWGVLVRLPSACPDQRNSTDEDRIDIAWPVDVGKPVQVRNRF